MRLLGETHLQVPPRELCMGVWVRTTGDCAELHCWCLHWVCCDAFTEETHLQVPARWIRVGSTAGDCAELNWLVGVCMVCCDACTGGGNSPTGAHGNYAWVFRIRSQDHRVLR